MSKKSNSRLAAVLSYFVVGIIWWLVDEKIREDSYVKFHIGQAIILLIAAVLVSAFSWILVLIPIFGSIALAVLRITITILWIIGVLNAIQGKRKALPLIGHFAKNLQL